jgi:hypothetical protein
MYLPRLTIGVGIAESYLPTTKLRTGIWGKREGTDTKIP